MMVKMKRSDVWRESLQAARLVRALDDLGLSCVAEPDHDGGLVLRFDYQDVRISEDAARRAAKA